MFVYLVCILFCLFGWVSVWFVWMGVGVVGVVNFGVVGGSVGVDGLLTYLACFRCVWLFSLSPTTHTPSTRTNAPSSYCPYSANAVEFEGQMSTNFPRKVLLILGLGRVGRWLCSHTTNWHILSEEAMAFARVFKHNR